MNLAVKFRGGPLAGQIRAYPNDIGGRLQFPLSSGGEVVYEKDESELSKDHFGRCGETVYKCIYNGLAKTMEGGK
jgi:hypothetical protein